MPDTPSSPRVADTLQPYVAKGALAGAVALVASRDGLLSVDAVGYSDLAARRPMTPDALFWIASTSKPITATALMMLVDEGRLDVALPVEHYLPEFAGQMLAVEQDDDHAVLRKPARPITVCDILTHTSGLPFMSRVERLIDTRPLREAVVSYALTPLRFEPGTQYQYANAGTNTAGRLIEVLTNTPYERFLQDRLFTPLGMPDTTFFPTEAHLARLAKSYRPNEAGTALEETTIGQVTYPLTAPRYPCPAGGLFSTAPDLARFGRMILRGGALDGQRYLSDHAVRTMTASHTPGITNNKGEPVHYGFCWGTAPADATSSWPGPGPATPCGHGGAYSNQFWLDPAHDRVLVYMVQHAGFRADGGKAAEAFKSAALAEAKTT